MNAADREIALHNRIRELEASRKLACDAWVVSNDRAAALEAERDELRADLDKAHATIVSIAVACATIDCEDLVAKHTTPDDYDDLVGHVERAVEEGHVLSVEVAKARALLTECAEEVEARGVDLSLAAAVREWLGVSDAVA